MSELHTINMLAQMAQTSCPPNQWRILESIDGSYSLEFSFDPTMDSNSPLFDTVKNRQGHARNYKNLNTLFADIKKVSPNALVHFFASQVG